MAVKGKTPDASVPKNEIILDPVNRTITIKNLVIKSDELYSFLEDRQDREDALRKAIVIGALGLKNMGTDVKMDYVDRKFSEFMSEVSRRFAEQHASVEMLIKETFDERNSASPMFKFAKNLETYFDDKTGVVRNLINNTFDPANKNSPVGALAQNLDLYFNESGKVRQILDSHFDMNNRKSSMSHFAEMLENNFDVDKGTIKHLLDPSRPGSPVNLLREEMLKNFNDVREKLSAAKAEQVVMERSTQKGGLFEDSVYEQLHAITNQHGDTVEAVGTVTGLTGKTGDFLIRLHDHGERIVIEAKDAGNYTIPRTIDEIQSAIENRKAAYGIFLFKTNDQMPRQWQPCRFEPNYIVTSMEGGGLYYAYHVAKTVLRSERMKNGGSIPVDKIQTEIEFLMKKSLVIEDAIKKARTINTAVESVESTLRMLQSEIDGSLRRIQNHLKNS